MKVFPIIKKLACVRAKQLALIERLEKSGDVDMDGLNLECAYLISGCRVKNGRLYHNGHRLDCGSPAGKYDDYFCFQQQGYCEDSWSGTLYFKTDVPGQYVAVPFEM